MVPLDMTLSKNNSKSILDNPNFNMRQLNFYPPRINTFLMFHRLYGLLHRLCGIGCTGYVVRCIGYVVRCTGYVGMLDRLCGVKADNNAKPAQLSWSWGWSWQHLIYWCHWVCVVRWGGGVCRPISMSNPTLVELLLSWCWVGFFSIKESLNKMW